MNALGELLSKLEKFQKSEKDIQCAVIGLSHKFPYKDNIDIILTNPTDKYDKKPMFEKVAILKENWVNEDWLAFSKDLHFDYDDGYGSQHLFGIVWFNGGTWLEREEYDGAEWWEHKSQPAIPDELKG